MSCFFAKPIDIAYIFTYYLVSCNYIFAFLILCKQIRKESQLNILITTHGNFGQGILDSYRMIAGENSAIHVISLTDEGVHSYRQALHKWLHTYQDNPILILSDLQGGTPFNESYQCFLENSANIRLLSGINLAMLLEVALQLPAELTLQEYAEIALKSGQDGVVLMEDDQSENDLEL